MTGNEEAAETHNAKRPALASRPINHVTRDVRPGLADHLPAAVRIAAGGATGNLRLTVDVDGVGIGPAGAVVDNGDRTGRDRAVDAGLRVLPLLLIAAIQRADAGGVVVALRVGIEAGADLVTEEAADKRAAEGYDTVDWYYSTKSL